MAILVSPEVAARIQELLTLQEGWDGEDAKPVRRESLARVLLLLRTLKQQRSRFRVPFIAPTFDGYLLLDWTAPRRTLEVQAKARGWSVVGTVTHHDGKKDYFSASADQDEADLMKYFEWFRDELLIWPTV
jgi:hypothetical protein